MSDEAISVWSVQCFPVSGQGVSPWCCHLVQDPAPGQDPVTIMIQDDIMETLPMTCRGGDNCCGKENTHQMQFKGRTLFVTYCEPRESRRAQLEELADKRAYEKCRMKAATTSNSDVMTLL